MRTGTAVDPIGLEVVRNAFDALVDEMALAVMRTAHSGVVKDAMDYSTALCDRTGAVIAQGLTIALHLGSFPDAVGAVLDKFGAAIAAGDMFILNDPYGSGGIHLPDIYVIKPIFVEGALEGFSAVVAHHTDVGGLVPGSNSTDSTEIYQEGLRIPALRLYEAGKPNETFFALLEKNVRLPGKVLGDLRAQIAAAHLGDRDYQGLAATHGPDSLRAYSLALGDYAESLARAGIREIPDGVYRFHSHIDADNIPAGLVVIAVELTVEGDEIRVDFEGSSQQVQAGINSPIPFSKAGVYAAIRLVLDPEIPHADGFNRPIRIRAPEGTVVNPVLPAACGARGITGFRVMDAVTGALAQALPDRVPADGEGGNSIISIGGYDSSRQPFAYVDLLSGARGATPVSDGAEGVPHPGANVSNTPVEIAEAELPILIEAYGMVQDSGGAGQFRGGLAQVRRVRCLADQALLQVRSDKRKFPPYGLAGGEPGSPSMNILHPDEARHILPTMGTASMKKGDVFLHQLAGGGGWGDPLERDLALVESDLRSDRVSPEAARESYGAVIDPRSNRIDREASERLRAEFRKARKEPRSGDPEG